MNQAQEPRLRGGSFVAVALHATAEPPSNRFPTKCLIVFSSDSIAYTSNHCRTDKGHCVLPLVCLSAWHAVCLLSLPGDSGVAPHRKCPRARLVLFRQQLSSRVSRKAPLFLQLFPWSERELRLGVLKFLVLPCLLLLRVKRVASHLPVMPHISQAAASPGSDAWKHRESQCPQCGHLPQYPARCPRRVAC